MKITHNLTIDLQRRGNLQKIDVVQGDTYTRLVNISLYNNGVLWDVPADSGILVRYHKPDGTSGIYEELPDGSPAGVIEENNVLITLAPQMLTAPGKVPTQVSIVVDDQVLSTFSFIVDVEEDSSKGAVGSENYHSWKSSFIPQTSGAFVGQYLEITAVDSYGRVEGVKAVVNPAIQAELMASDAKRAATESGYLANEASETAKSAYAYAKLASENATNANELATSVSGKADEALKTANDANNLSARNADDIADLMASKLPQVTGAKVGQYIKITEVDNLGRVVAFEAVNAPASGSISGDLEMQGDSINNVGSLSFIGPSNTSVDGFWIQSGAAVSKEDGSKTSVVEFYSSDTDDNVVIRNVAPGVEDRDAVNLAQLNSIIDTKPDAIKNAVEDYLKHNPIDVPVESVNGKMGDVKLTAEDVGAISLDDSQKVINDALAQAKASGEFDGRDGKDGANGKDGTSATHSWNGTVLTISSASGTSSADLKGAKGDKGDKGDTGAQGIQGVQGAPGANGSNGVDGKTPVRGTDYWTEADKAEMVEDVVAEMQATITEPMDGDMPKVFLTGSEFSNMTNDKNEVNMEMEYRSKTKQFHAYIGIKFQGTSSLDYAKKNFTVKLFDDEAHASKQTHLFRDWKYAKNKFVLKANYIDHSHARNIVCANLWDEIVASRSDYSSLPEELRNSPKNGAVDGFPIKLYVNGTYQGIYTWNIGKDDWTWGMDEDNANHILLCVENNSDRVYKERPYNFRALWDGASAYFEVEIGTKATAKTPINNLISFVMNNDGTAFRNGIGEYLDVQSAIDYYIHQYVICGLDGLAKNMLLGTYDGKKWYCNAYDMDSTLGLYWNGRSFVSPTYKCPEDYCEPFNLLWERLEANFWSEIKTRYAQLRNTVYSVGNIFTHFEQFMDTIGLDLYAEDLEIYPNIPNGSTNNIKQLRNYIRDRLAYCDAKITNGTPATAVTLNKTTLEINTIGSTVTLTATATPSNHTDEVMWLSSNDSIATVTNGVVKAVTDGECEIRAKCGSGYAVCTVKVSSVVLPTYTNQVPISTDENGNVYNGTGYKDGYRIRSNGEEQSFKSTCTGFIPAKAGDVVRLYCPTDGVFLATTANKSSFNVYDASKTMLGQMATDATYGTFGNTSNKWEDITKVNGVFEYTIPSNVGDVAFIRLAVGFPSGIEPTGAGMIVTVNQEIK